MKARITKAQLHAATTHASTDTTRKGLNGVVMTPGQLVSLDGHRMAVITTECETKTDHFLPLGDAKRIEKMARKNEWIELLENSVAIQEADRGASGIRLEPSIPDHRRVREAAKSPAVVAQVSLNARYLADAAKAAAEISGDPNAPVTLIFRETETPLILLGGFERRGQQWSTEPTIEVLIMPVRV